MLQDKGWLLRFVSKVRSVIRSKSNNQHIYRLGNMVTVFSGAGVFGWNEKGGGGGKWYGHGLVMYSRRCRPLLFSNI